MTVTPPEARQPLRPLLARIWRDYLSERKGRLALAMLCAAITAGTTALILRLLEPAVNGLFVDQDPNALWMIPAAIAGVGVIRGAAAIGQANLVNRLGHGWWARSRASCSPA
ncbi:hypothetical protein [Brevundimonas denitrificans]|uniref:hypothetical protein n=1 Tax=Brevundimonas denitrificans TaxID=1443434 RepID=UPI00352F9793